MSGCDADCCPHWFFARRDFFTLEPGESFELTRRHARLRVPRLLLRPRYRGTLALVYRPAFDVERARTTLEEPTGTRDCCSGYAERGTHDLIARLHLAPVTSAPVAVETGSR